MNFVYENNPVSEQGRNKNFQKSGLTLFNMYTDISKEKFQMCGTCSIK